MAVATLQGGQLQRVYLATSTNGLKWKLERKKLIVESGVISRK